MGRKLRYSGEQSTISSQNEFDRLLEGADQWGEIPTLCHSCQSSYGIIISATL